MVQQGLGESSQSPKVPITSVGPDTTIRAPLGKECNNTCPKTIEDYMRNSASFCYARIGSWCNTSFSGGAKY
jgi:hypothetical protein